MKGLILGYCFEVDIIDILARIDRTDKRRRASSTSSRFPADPGPGRHIGSCHQYASDSDALALQCQYQPRLLTQSNQLNLIVSFLMLVSSTPSHPLSNLIVSRAF
jgi:hypothetical protein